MTGPIQTLRFEYDWTRNRLGTPYSGQSGESREQFVAALTQVENLVRAAQNALPCVDRNATFPAQMLADALAPFKDTP